VEDETDLKQNNIIKNKNKNGCDRAAAWRASEMEWTASDVEDRRWEVAGQREHCGARCIEAAWSGSWGRCCRGETGWRV